MPHNRHVPSHDDRLIAGRYRLRRRLGQGAMGVVWEAYDEFLRRRVAVKEVLLPPGVPPEEAAELRERTLREARAIAALSHPNVITLHDVARDNDEPFVVTEYIAAHSVAGLVRVLGPLAEASAAAIADAVAAALASAHQAGITHRDVKPGNVLVAEDGQVKLTDFGIARNVSEHTITQTGIMLGSPAYMAPEVGAGHDVTPAADLWGLGATLFAVVEGHPPYDTGKTALEVVNQVVHGDVPRPESTGPLSELVTALMVKDPADRLPLAEVRARLQPLLPPAGTPLITDAQREQLADAPEADEEPDLVPLATEGSAPEQPAPDAEPALAPAPGPLPFEVTARAPGRRRRGRVATTVVVVLALLLFCAGTGGGFALARVVGGEPVDPPRQTTGTTKPPVTTPSELELAPETGDAATRSGTQGGAYTVPVPTDWTKFVEERSADGADSTRVYYVSPDGTRILTIDRYPGFFPDGSLDKFIAGLTEKRGAETVELISNGELTGQGDPEPARQLMYRTTADATVLAPNDPAASNLNRTTYANLLPLGPDLWVVAVTVPVDQEDTGRRELFDRIAPQFSTSP
jgi:eukaryotic-like serine/threonine-protein kinase